MRKLPRLALAASLAVLPLAAVPACQTSRTAEVPVQETLGSARQLQMEIDRTDAEVVAALDALARVEGDDVDKLAAYEQLQRRVESLKADQQAFQGQATSLQENARAYESKWNQDLVTIRDPDLKESAVQRQGDVQKSLEGVTRRYRTASDELDPFVREVQGIQTYLRNDLTPQGVKAISKEFDSAEEKGQAAREALSELQDELSTMTRKLDDQPMTSGSTMGG